MEQISSFQQFILVLENNLMIFPEKKKFDAFLHIAKFLASNSSSEVLQDHIENFEKDLKYSETFVVTFEFDKGYKTELGLEWGCRQNPETRKEILVIAKIKTGKKADEDGRIKEGKYYLLGSLSWNSYFISKIVGDEILSINGEVWDSVYVVNKLYQIQKKKGHVRFEIGRRLNGNKIEEHFQL